MGKKVTFVRFKNSLYVPGVGETGNQFPSQSKSFEVDMETDSAGLSVKLGHAGKTVNVLIPYENIVTMVTADLPPTPTTAVKPKSL